MIRHVVTWKLKDHAEGAPKAANAARVKEVLEAMRGRVPGLRSLEVGVDVKLDPDAWDVVLVTELDDRAAFAVYQDHPLHLAAKLLIGKVRAERSAVDYETDGSSGSP